MEIKQIANWLLENQYMVLLAGKPVLTSKFEKEVGYIATEPVLTETVNQIQVNSRLEKPTSYTQDLKEIWNLFIDSCEIPWRIKNNVGEYYTLRQFSKSIAKRLEIIIRDPNIDYSRLVQSTKEYYKTTTYKLLLSNYIDKGVWRDAYNNWNGKSVNVSVLDGSSRFED